jgi:membrane-associated phospholipid phosphatase
LLLARLSSKCAICPSFSLKSKSNIKHSAHLRAHSSRIFASDPLGSVAGWFLLRSFLRSSYHVYENYRLPTVLFSEIQGAGIATLLDLGIKAAFGRLRPSQTSSHTAFFHGGQSFVSGDVAPMFALAAGASEYFHNEWYVAAPVYSLALLDGFGGMGHDAHWFSDVVGAALLGVGTTELFIRLHNRHDKVRPDLLESLGEVGLAAGLPTERNCWSSPCW